ncbi:MAG: YciI family protein, partial [Myxococcales bacterium]|nr:YciI family protein [Myxococcales bacterium]
MQYLLMIYDNETAMKDVSPEAREKFMDEYRVFTEAIVKAGQFKAGDALQPTATATSVRVREGKTLTTDGPFAETKEQL